MDFLNATVPMNLFPLTWLMPSGRSSFNRRAQANAHVQAASFSKPDTLRSCTTLTLKPRLPCPTCRTLSASIPRLARPSCSP